MRIAAFDPSETAALTVDRALARRRREDTSGPQRPLTHIRCVKTAWHNALKIAGLPRFPIYQCRATFATRPAAGVSDTIIDQLLGHSRRDVLRFYTARVPEYLRDAINLLDQLRSAKATAVSTASKIGAIEERSERGSTLVN